LKVEAEIVEVVEADIAVAGVTVVTAEAVTEAHTLALIPGIRPMLALMATDIVGGAEARVL